MNTSGVETRVEKACNSSRPTIGGWRGASGAPWWSLNREATLNWLALGLLLAAWNATDSDPTPQEMRRPESLRGYTYVSVRAQRSTSTD
jgi:hypothetical protein